LQLTADEIRQLGEKVKTSDTYNTIAFNFWTKVLEDPKSETAKQIIERRAERRAYVIIAERRRQIGAIQFNEEYLEKLGLRDVQLVMGRRLYEHLEKARERAKVKEKVARAFVRRASQEIKQELKEILIQKGFSIESDPYWQESLPFYAVEILEEIGAMMKRLPPQERS